MRYPSSAPRCALPVEQVHAQRVLRRLRGCFRDGEPVDSRWPSHARPAHLDTDHRRAARTSWRRATTARQVDGPDSAWLLPVQSVDGFVIAIHVHRLATTRSNKSASSLRPWRGEVACKARLHPFLARLMDEVQDRLTLHDHARASAGQAPGHDLEMPTAIIMVPLSLCTPGNHPGSAVSWNVPPRSFSQR